MRFDLVKNSDGTMRMSNPLGDYIAGGGVPSDYEGTETHYASPTGTNSWTAAAVSSLTPCSIETAMQNVVPGNRVKLLPGTLDCAGNDFNDPYLRPNTSGTAGNEIVFFAENPAIYNRGATDTVLTRFRNNTNIGALFGNHSSQLSYIILDGVDFPEYQNTDSDGAYQIVLFDCDHITISKCTFNGENQATSGFNHGFIWCDGVDELLIEDCYLENNSGSGENAAAIMYYGTTNTTLRNCTFDNNETHLFIKGEGTHGINGSLVIEENKFLAAGYSGISVGGHQEGPSPAPDPNYRSYIRQNIFYDIGRMLNGIQYTQYHSYITILNNTFYLTSGTISSNFDCAYMLSTAVTAGNTGNQFYDNLIVECGASFGAENDRVYSSTGLSSQDIDGNYYFNNDYIFSNGNQDSTVTSLSTWQSTYNHDDTVGTQGSNPNFQSTNPTDANFLKLNAGSPALTASRSSGPVGAYITGSEVIGARETA